jgi:hypothetical protein
LRPAFARASPDGTTCEGDAWTALTALPSRRSSNRSQEPLQVGRDDRALGQKAEDAREELLARVASMPAAAAAWLNGRNAWQRHLLSTEEKVWQRWLVQVGVTERMSLVVGAAEEAIDL